VRLLGGVIHGLSYRGPRPALTGVPATAIQMSRHRRGSPTSPSERTALRGLLAPGAVTVVVSTGTTQSAAAGCIDLQVRGDTRRSHPAATRG
jgi:hypothetical protein